MNSPDLCVVFDIDDTLFLERDYVRSGFAEIERLRRLHGFADCAWQLFLDGVRGNTIDLALTALGVEPDVDHVRQLVQLYRRHSPEIRLLPDARDWLERHRSDTRLACVTDGPLTSQQAKVGALELTRWCSPIVMTAALGTGFGKPHVRAFQEVARTSGLAPHRHVYVADNPRKDFDAPCSLGWRTVRIRRDGALHQEVPTPDFVDHELTDLRDLDLFFERHCWGAA